MVFVLAAEEEGSRVPHEGDPPTVLTPALKLVTLTNPLWAFNLSVAYQTLGTAALVCVWHLIMPAVLIILLVE